MIFLLNILGTVFCFKFGCSLIYDFLNSIGQGRQTFLETDRTVNILGCAGQEDLVKSKLYTRPENNISANFNIANDDRFLLFI